MAKPYVHFVENFRQIGYSDAHNPFLPSLSVHGPNSGRRPLVNQPVLVDTGATSSLLRDQDVDLADRRVLFEETVQTAVGGESKLKHPFVELAVQLPLGTGPGYQDVIVGPTTVGLADFDKMKAAHTGLC